MLLRATRGCNIWYAFTSSHEHILTYEKKSRVTESLKTKLRHQGDEISLKTVAFLEIETSDRALMAKIDAIELKGVKREHDIIIVGELISSCEVTLISLIFGLYLISLFSAYPRKLPQSSSRLKRQSRFISEN